MDGHLPRLSPIVDEATLAALAEHVYRRRADSASKAEWIRWAVVLVLSGMLSYLTTNATMREAITDVRTTEHAHFQELLRRLDIMQQDIRELRK